MKGAGSNMLISLDEQYLTVRELSEKIKFSQQTIYNMIHKGDFAKGKHYIKPRPKKVLFIWSAIATWLSEYDESIPNTEPVSKEARNVNKGLINI
jgi:predicted DNA-binding transcriptional regulator AlpA